jgi:Peptidase family M48
MRTPSASIFCTKCSSLLAFPIFLFYCSALFGQSIRTTPYYNAATTSLREKLAEEAAVSIRAAFRTPEKFDKEAQKDYETSRENIVSDVTEQIKNSAIPDDALWAFVKKTHAVIVAANPEAASTKVILSINPTPNAFSIGDGTIMVYNGLLAGLENEDQLAFVLCHEIAHFLLEHSTKGLVKRIQTYHSKEFKSKVAAASKQEFNRIEQLENIYKSAALNSRYHHRDLERQADSLAYRLFVKTAYDPLQAQRLIQLFEFIDEPMRDTVVQLETRFGCTEFPFKTTWLDQGGGSVWSAAQAERIRIEKPMEDSLRTHPDWRNRLQWLEEMTGKKLPTGALQTDSVYAKIRFLSALECVEAWFDVERYDRSLYYALQYEKVYPACGYFREIQALSLYGLYEHSKEHSLADVLSQRSPDHPEQYNRYLDFLNNLRLKEILGLQTCSTQALPAKNTEYALLGAYCLAKAREDTGAMVAAKKEYVSAYRNGRFLAFFKESKP